MAVDMRKMAAYLRGRDYPRLTLPTHVFDGEIQKSAPPAQTGRGLKVLLT